jgi:hypothetical protein
MKKISWVGDSRIPKMQVINPLEALVHLQIQKTILHGISIPTPTSQNSPLLVNRSAD